MPGPIPRRLPGAFARFFPEDSGLPAYLTGSALPLHTPTATSVRKGLSGLQTFLDVEASKFARHPGRSDRWSQRRMAAVTLLPSLVWFVTSPYVGYANRPNRAIGGRGLTPH